MKMKKLCASFMLVVMLISMFSAMPLLNPAYDYGFVMQADAAGNMRRPLSNEQPMLIVHIDTWNLADPAKIIALIPEDIKPYVVFNISLSINWDRTNKKWLMVQDGYNCAKSWLRTCADEGVWAMVQPASGGQCHFPDYPANYDFENTLFAEFFRDYPNFIGFNYSEQFWGFESVDFPVTPLQRYQHFAGLLKLCNKYGGFLDINWCANRWSAPLNPVAMLKKSPEWEAACRNYSQNLILAEKYTQGSFIHDVESEIFGAYISGYCDNFGVRYDETGWTDLSADNKPLPTKEQYIMSTGTPIHLERMALNGATVIDGPELIWADDFKEVWGVKDSEGYNMRAWAMHDQYQNAALDVFRKMLDGTVRIPTRQEVIDRTKVVIIQDNNSGDDHNKYSTYPSLFEGLYRMPGDGNLWDNTNLYKSTGRYPTIPTVYALKDNLAKSIAVQIKQSTIPSRWSSIAAKQQEFNKLFPSEYSGNCYAGRYENTWVTYNPNKRGDIATGVLPLKYNTSKQLEVSYSAYASAIINEYSDRIDLYVNNYDEDNKTTLRTNTFKISGCSSQPTFTYKDTGVNQVKSVVSGSWSGDTYTLTVRHNGPVSISVKCSGRETNRLTSYKTARLIKPASPSFYTGPRQYEGEFFDNKNIEGITANGCGSGLTGFWGQGFLKFGTKSNATVKDTVKTDKAGTFNLTLRYSVTSNINNVDLYVNGSKVKTLSLPRGSSLSDWKTVKEQITLRKGENKVEFRATSALASSLYIDNFIVDGDFGDASTPPVVNNPLNGTRIKNLIVADTANASSWSIANNFNKGSQLFGDRDFTCTDLPSHLVGAEYIRTACDSKTVLSNLGTFNAGSDMTVYVAVDSRVVPSLPEWLKSWNNSGHTISTSNELTLVLYQKNVSSGETVTLGTNGGSTNSVNYIVLASATGNAGVVGDANGDKSFNSIDFATVRLHLLGVNVLTGENLRASDVNGDGQVNAIDFALMRQHLLGIITSFVQ